jgi:predicted phosphodiesterase
MTGITWLHLSDWHEGAEREQNRFDRDIVFNHLIEDLKARDKLDPNLSKIDFIIFSGDVAFSGQSEQYAKAWDKFFQKILDATGLNSEKLFIIPGNHDINRDTLSDANFQQNFSLTLDRLEVNNWLSDGSKRTNFFKPFTEFKQFAEDYLQHQKDPVYASTLLFDNIGNKRVALLGLNSALMSGRNKNLQGEISDQANLFVGEHQIVTGLNKIKDYDVKIAVLHHPREWLINVDLTSFDQHLNNFDFVLCGHRHISQTVQLSGMGGHCHIIAAGASYSSRDYSNGYNFVHYEPDTHKVKIYLRRWEDDLGRWINAPFLDDTGKVVYTGCYESPSPKIPTIPRHQLTGDEALSPDKQQEKLKEHYSALVTAITGGIVVPILGTDINLCDRPDRQLAPWDWNKPQDNPPKRPYPPTNVELAAYLERQFASYSIISCPYGYENPDGPRGLPPECPLNRQQVTWLDLPHISQDFWSRSHETGPSTLSAAINNIYNLNYESNSIYEFLANCLIKRYQTQDKDREDQCVPTKCPLIVTTCFDQTLERAFKKYKQPFELISYSDQDRNFNFKYQKFVLIDEYGEEKVRPSDPISLKKAREQESEEICSLKKLPVILRLYGPIGGIQDGENFAITEDHFLNYLVHLMSNSSELPPELLAKLSNSHLWFLGYNVSYWYLRIILCQIAELTQKVRNKDSMAWWAVQEEPKHLERELWNINHVNLFSNLSFGSWEKYIQEISSRFTV